MLYCSSSHHRTSTAQGFLKVSPDAGPQPTRVRQNPKMHSAPSVLPQWGTSDARKQMLHVKTRSRTKLWIELPWPENPANTYAWHTEHWIAVSTLLGLISSAYRDFHHWTLNKWLQIAEAKLYNWANSQKKKKKRTKKRKRKKERKCRSA